MSEDLHCRPMPRRVAAGVAVWIGVAGLAGAGGGLSGLAAGPPASALAFSYPGRVDTDIALADVVAGDFTLAVRLLPQYPFAYAGPFVAQTGTEPFFFGQGYFRGWEKNATPLLDVTLGKTFHSFPVPRMVPGAWRHAALVRQGATVRVYLDGARLNPDLHLQGEIRASGTLRLGRCADGVKVDGHHDSQFYGLLHDVAVVYRALSDAEIRDLAAAADPRALLSRPPHTRWLLADRLGSERLHLTGPVQRVAVSRPLDSARDLRRLPLPRSAGRYILPFRRGEAWEVIQGTDDPKGSHNSYAAFCWDFDLAGKPQSATRGVPFFAAAPGRLVYVRENLTQPPPAKDANLILVATEDGSVHGYLHLLQGSFTASFRPRLPALPQHLAESRQPHVVAGQLLARTGDVGAGAGAFHVHFGNGDRADTPAGHDDLVTMPIAFSDYQLSRDGGRTWTPVALGIPRQGDWVRNPPVAARPPGPRRPRGRS